jgi:hypothetical protein
MNPITDVFSREEIPGGMKTEGLGLPTPPIEACFEEMVDHAITEVR